MPADTLPDGGLAMMDVWGWGGKRSLEHLYHSPGARYMPHLLAILRRCICVYVWCMYAYIYKHTHICMCIYLHVSVHVSVYMCIFVCMLVYHVFACLSMCVYMCVQICVCMCVCVGACMSLYMYACPHVLIVTHTYMHALFMCVCGFLY